MEFWDFLCARYNVTPLDLQSHCDGCGTAFKVTRELICSKGVLVIPSHNKVSGKLFFLSRRAFTPSPVFVKPLIHQGRKRSDKEIRQGSDKDKEMRGYMMIRGLWDRQAEYIIDVKLGDTDAYSYKYDPMVALLDRWETIKKDKQGNHCHNQRVFFLRLLFLSTEC